MKKKTKIILGSMFLIVLISGVSFAYWYQTFIQTKENSIVTDCFKMNFLEDTATSISLDKMYPMTQKEVEQLKPYTFSIENVCSSGIEYQINLESLNDSNMPEKYLNYSFLKEETSSLNKSVAKTLDNAKSSNNLETGILYPNEKRDYNFKLWMSETVTMENSDAMNKVFNGKITVVGTYKTTYQEPILNGTDPVLKNNLIPITISNDGTVKKADMSKSWYSYENKLWANAIILEDETKTYNDGEIIPEINIESYFVWIPRYRYKIFNEGNYTGLTNIENKVQTIEVLFENKNINPSKGSTVGQWLTPTAFTSFDSNGMWVGKFESGYKGATTTTQAQINVNDSSKLEIKPNVYSWRGLQVSNAHLTSFNYERDLDSHMMKNTEWGSVAYLQHSKYGSQASVRINNNAGFITGYSAVMEPTCRYTAQNDECNKYEETLLNADGTYTKKYNSDTGYLASTTGNISGIYDMSGGTWEAMMGVMLDKNNKPMSGRNSLYNSGFNGTFGCPTCDSDTSGKIELTIGIDFPDTKYYDVYAYTEIDERFDRRILGDATGEMGPFGIKSYGIQKRHKSSWYEDELWFVMNQYPLVFRGGVFSIGNDTGIFATSSAYNHGSGYNAESFRTVLTL